MPLLTKKFTRDSMKRANGGGMGISNASKDQAKAEMIQIEMARARAKSMRSRNVLHQQQQSHRSLSRGPSSSHRSFTLESARNLPDQGRPTPTTSFSHPNDEYSEAFNEAELFTQMSSLTEPTWAPSVVGGLDINSANHPHNPRNERSRTANYNGVCHQTRFQHNNTRLPQNRTKITISSAKDHKETKVLLLDDGEKQKPNIGHIKSNSNCGHHERASIQQNECRGDDGDNTHGSATKRLSKDTESSGIRDDVPDNNVLLSTSSRTKQSISSRRSKTRGADDESNASRTRGRSDRPIGNRKTKKRSSSISSERSKQSTRTASTAPTISKHSSTSSSQSAYRASRQSKTYKTNINRRRRTTCGKEKSSTDSRSSSVPPSTSNSKRSQRTSSMPPNLFNMREMTHYNRYSDASGDNQSSNLNTKFHKNLMDATVDTTSTLADLTAVSSQSNIRSKVSFTTGSQASGISLGDSFSTPSSSIEAARMSLRPRLRRSNSNRSMSSAQSESIVSNTGNRKGSSAETYEKSQIPVSAALVSSSNTTHANRMHKLAQDVRTKKIRKQRQLRRHERETERHRQQQQQQEKRRWKEAKVDASATEAVGIEPHPTTTTTLVFDFLVFLLLLLITLPQRAVLSLLSRVFSKKWTARRKNVLVTCANSALGSETARQFASEGANLILIGDSKAICVGMSSENGLNWLVDECQELGSGKTQCYSANLSNAASIEHTLRQAAKDFNDTFDVIILNGETKSHGCRFEEILDVHQIEDLVIENTLGCIIALHYSLKHIPKSSNSRIVILSSTSGVIASPYRSVYGATQHALKGFCDSIRMELNDTYTERRAPKICFALFPELVGQNIQNRENIDRRFSRMGADTAPMKTRSWAGIPLQQAVHDLMVAVTSGKRDFGAPLYVNAWRFLQVVAPRLVDFSIFRHFRKTLYRPVEGNKDVSKGRKGDKCPSVTKLGLS